MTAEYMGQAVAPRRSRGYDGDDVRRRYGPGARNGDGGMTLDAGALSRGIGWFSIGLGAVAVAAPGALARLVGVPETSRNTTVMRAVGLRELACGVGILADPGNPAWLWARVAGDAVDLGLLGLAMREDEADTERLAAATAAVVGIAAVDAVAGESLGGGGAIGHTLGIRPEGGTARAGSEVGARLSVAVNKPPEELYRWWRDFSNLPRFMQYLEKVETQGDRRSHWRAKAPLGMTIEWDAEVTEDEPGRRICWRSLPGAELANSGEVEFRPAPGGRGSIVHVDLRYEMPGGKAGQTLAKLLGHDPAQLAGQDLRAFKALMEVGEVLLSDATAKGSGPARPPTPEEQTVQRRSR